MASSQEYIRTLSDKKIQEFIFVNEHADVATIALKQKTIEGTPSAWVAEQIKSRKKIKQKLPKWFNTKGIVYPPALNLEQSSSELTAKFKASIAQQVKAKSIADVSAGFGVDAYYLSKVCEHLHHVEPNKSLLEIASHNHQVLQAKNIIYHHSDAASFVKTFTHKLDLIFVDPSRRSNTGKKVFLLKDCEPDIVQWQDKFLEQAKYLLIKTSPILDIDAGLRSLKHVKAVYVLSVDNECKELLFLAEANYSGDVQLNAVLLGKDKEEMYQQLYSKETTKIATDEASNYLYEPDAAISKAGMADTIAAELGLTKLHTNTVLYSSNALQNKYPGRVFKVLAPVKLNRESLQKFFPDYAASISTRNYPASAEELRKKTKLKEDEAFFLWAFTDVQGKRLMACRRVL